MTGGPAPSAGPGTVVLAAYRPDPELFGIQLRSIRDQTRSDFTCLVGADGGQEAVRALVADAVGDDPRFRVVGWDDNVGFYLNFERLLRAVPDDASWVALSDQDDRWYPDKLERLVPHLDDVPLVTGQARVIRWPDREVVVERTDRRVVPAVDLAFENQVTGSLSVLRRGLVDLALPFPRLHTVTQLHDHWLAMCAVSTGGYTVVDDVVQDYVQHGGNLVGEVATHRGWTPASIVRRIVELGDTYEGGHSLPRCARACQALSFGWRRLVLETLRRRVTALPPGLSDLHRQLGPRAGRADAVRLLWRAARSPRTNPWVVATFVPGLPYELWFRRAGRHRPLATAREDVHYRSDVVERSEVEVALESSPEAAPLHVGRPNLGPRELFDRYVDRIYASQWLTNDGPIVRELEEAVASRTGVRHCVAMSNGTVALEIAIRAAGLTGEVIVPSFTFVATAHALHWQGLTPVFADIDPVTHTLDPRSVEAAITPRTSGIIGVHLWGQAAEVSELEDVARRHDLTLMFDAAHAFDCTADGRPVGGNGVAEVFSFHATKFFNSFEGGAIVTDDEDLAERARLMRNFGFSGYDNVIHPGTNGKMTEICAAMGLVNLVGLDDVVSGNRRTMAAYREAFDPLPGISLFAVDPAERSNHQYVVALVDDPGRRDAVVDALHGAGILARKYFWPGVHRMKPYADLPCGQVRLPHTDAVAARVVVLPTGPKVTARDVDVVAATIGKVLT